MLKKVIFEGFKSFADRVEAEFSNGISAVIGPNGCGKSNINDGVRWVLGSQSAKDLRGGKMEDVIFNGSDKRKQKNEAEVTLVLDNTSRILNLDLDEVAVTRKIVRNKGSEYQINGEPVRLKDVQDLFMDSGIGANSYSIIGQGQVNKILSTKLEERRAIFEEAAGIVKLKHQKEQTEKRLMEVNQNLTRLDDIIAELKKQLDPLRRQSKKAREYNEISSELQSIETQYLLHVLDEIEKEVTNASLFVGEKQADITHMSALFEANETALNEKKESYQTDNEELFTAQQNFSNVKEEYEKINGIVALNDERIINTKKRIGEIEEQLKEIESTYSLSTEDFKEKKQRLQQVLFQIEHCEKTMEEVKASIEHEENQKMFFQSDLQVNRERSTELYNEVQQQKYQLDSYNEKEKELESLKAMFASKTHELSKEKAELEVAFEKAENAYQSASNETTSVQEKLHNVTENLTSLKGSIQQASKEVQTLETEYIRQKSKMESFESILANFEMFYDGVKAVLQYKKERNLDGVYGTLAELVQVEKQYEVAIENLLQSSMQFVVTKDDRVASQCITYLKENKLGRATFSPLNLATQNAFSSSEKTLVEETKGVRLALEAVTFEEHVRPVVSSFLGKCVIADNLDIARSFAKNKQIRCKIVTLDGELIQAGTMSGGQSKHQKTSFFARRRELDELKISTQTLAETLGSKKEQLATFEQQLLSLEIEQKALQNAFEENRTLSSEKLALYQEAQRRFDHLSEKYEENELKEKESALSLKETKQSIVKLTFSIEEKEKTYAQHIAEIESLNAQLQQNEQTLKRLELEKNAEILQMERHLDEKRNLSEFLETFSQDNVSVEEKIETLQTRKEAEEKSLVEYMEHKNLSSQEAQKMKAELIKLEAHITTLRDETKHFVVEIEQLEKDIENMRQAIGQLEKEVNKKEVFLSKKETEKEHIYSRLEETYEYTIEEVASLERIEIDIKSSKKNIDGLKAKIQSLGSINHTAIEECEKLEERYKTESEQLQDVKEAKADLLSLIETVKADMTERFITTFNEIAANFTKIFKDLFEGGRASLSLVDEKNPLTSAIEIIAQPPGKKPQTIDSLSGGEKAFTAVALIFSIITAKPSPFIILDEVDAPLDDANVARFAYYLKTFKEKSQFIVVTHRKGTMHVADRLFGVTQEEPGVTILFPHTLNILDEEKTS